MLGEIMHESLVQNELFVTLLDKKPILVPIPLSSKRLRKRGYNQAELLAKELEKQFGLTVELLLKRVRETKPQYGLKREERIENIKEAFALNDQRSMTNFQGKTVLLVDDVLTTGSTMSEAAKILKKAGAKEVWGVAFSKD